MKFRICLAVLSLYLYTGVSSSRAYWCPHSHSVIPTVVNNKKPLVSKYVPIPNSPFNKEGVSILALASKIQKVHVSFDLSRKAIGIVKESLAIVGTVLRRQVAIYPERPPARTASLPLGHVGQNRVVEHISSRLSFYDDSEQKRVTLECWVIVSSRVFKLNPDLRPLNALRMFSLRDAGFSSQQRRLSRFASFVALPNDSPQSHDNGDSADSFRPRQESIEPIHALLAFGSFLLGCYLLCRERGFCWWIGWLFLGMTWVLLATGRVSSQSEQNQYKNQPFLHGGNVSRNPLTSTSLL